jgi:hypothetical protein
MMTIELTVHLYMAAISNANKVDDAECHNAGANGYARQLCGHGSSLLVHLPLHDYHLVGLSELSCGEAA